MKKQVEVSEEDRLKAENSARNRYRYPFSLHPWASFIVSMFCLTAMGDILNPLGIHGLRWWAFWAALLGALVFAAAGSKQAGRLTGYIDGYVDGRKSNRS